MELTNIKEFVLIFLLVFSIALLASGLTLYIYTSSSFSNDCVTKNYEKNDSENRSDLRLVMNDLEREIKEIYKYNVTDDDINLSYRELRSRGGDCKDWAEYWIKRAEEEGYNAEYDRVYLYSEETDNGEINHYHAYAKIGNENGWCIAAGNHVKCWGFE